MKKLGEGTFGKVFLLKNQNVAAKFIDLSKVRIEDAELELKIGLSLNHTNVLKYYTNSENDNANSDDQEIQNIIAKYFLDTPIFIIRTAFCNGDSLQDWILSLDLRRIHKKLADDFFSQILYGMTYLASKFIIHGDLKPHNIYLHHSKNDTKIIIGDFGEAMECDANAVEIRKCGGTPLYCDKDSRGEPSYDIYALGLIYSILVMTTSLHFDKDFIPTSGYKKNLLHNLLGHIKRESKAGRRITWIQDKRMRSLVEKMLNPVKDARPNAFQVKDEFDMIKCYQFSSFCSPPEKNPMFEGQNDVLTQLRNRALRNEDGKSLPKCFLVYGIPGTGKKTTVAEFLHTFETPENIQLIQHVAWFQASTKTSLESSCERFSEELYQNTKRKERNCNLKEYFESDSSGNWILVYENVQKFQDIVKFIPSMQEASQTFSIRLVICTSRQVENDWPDYFHLIQILPLQIEECKKLIQNVRSLRDVNHKMTEEVSKDSEALAIQMGRLPTAILQSLVFISVQSIRENGINTIARFLKYHEECKKSSIMKLLQLTKSNSSPLYMTLYQTLEAIRESNQIAFDWIQICGFLNGDSIPEFLFEGFLTMKNAETTKLDIVNLLNLYAIFAYDEVNCTFTVSRPVQDTCQIIVSQDNTFEKVIEDIQTLFKRSSPNMSNQTFKANGHVKKRSQLIPHYELVIQHIENYYQQQQLNISEPSCMDLCFKGIKTFEKPRDILKGLLHMKFSTLKSLIKCYRSVQNTEKTRELEKQVFSLKESLYGQQSLILGTSLLASGRQMLGHPKKKTKNLPEINAAILELEQAEVILKDCYNQNDLAHCYNYLGSAYFYRAMAKGKRQDRKIIFDRQDLVSSLNYHKKSLYVFTKVYETKKSSETSRIQKTLQYLAGTYGRHGDVYANEYMGKCLHLALQFEVGSWNNGDTDDDDQGFSVSTKRKIICAETFKFLSDIDNYQLDWEILGKLQTNSERLTRSVSGTLNQLATYFTLTNDKDRAELMANLRKQVIEKQNECFDRAKISAFTITNASQSLGTLSEVETSQRNIKTSTVAVFDAKIKTARELKARHRIQDALIVYNEALELRLAQMNSTDDILMAYLYEEIGTCHALLSNRLEAIEHFKCSYEIQKNLTNMTSFRKEKSIRFAELMLRYAKLLSEENEIDLKLQLLEESVAILKKYFHKNHNELAFNYEKIGKIYLTKCNYEEAWKHLIEALEIFQKNLPLGNQNRVSCLKKIMECCNKSRFYHCKLEAYREKYEIESKFKSKGVGISTLIQVVKKQRNRANREERSRAISEQRLSQEPSEF